MEVEPIEDTISQDGFNISMMVKMNPDPPVLNAQKPFLE